MMMRQTASSAIPQRFSSTGKRVRSRILSFRTVYQLTTQCSRDYPAAEVHNAVQPRLPCYGSSLSGNLAHGEQLGYHPDYNGANLEAKMQLFIGISRRKAG